jgi:hypothetical protein
VTSTSSIGGSASSLPRRRDAAADAAVAPAGLGGAGLPAGRVPSVGGVPSASAVLSVGAVLSVVSGAGGVEASGGGGDPAGSSAGDAEAPSRRRARKSRTAAIPQAATQPQ